MHWWMPLRGSTDFKAAMETHENWEVLNRAIISCRSCPRLVQNREGVATLKKRQFRDQPYWGKAVTGFGDPLARLLIIGLAPAAHGANRTGRVFTGDSSGDWLFDALYRFGYGSRPDSVSREDGMQLRDTFISAVVRCAPPQNRPSAEELLQCRSYLHSEIHLLSRVRLIITLGRIAMDHYWSLFRTLHPGADRIAKPPFLHGGVTLLPNGQWLLTSYHPSRQNTQTGRLTKAMWYDIFTKAKKLIAQVDRL